MKVSRAKILIELNIIFDFFNLKNLNSSEPIFNVNETHDWFSVSIWTELIQEFQLLKKKGTYYEEDICKYFQELLDSKLKHFFENDNFRFTYFFYDEWDSETKELITFKR